MEKIASPYPYSDDGSVLWPAHTPWPDPWVAIGAMAAVTETLRFATGIQIARRRVLHVRGDHDAAGHHALGARTRLAPDVKPQVSGLGVYGWTVVSVGEVVIASGPPGSGKSTIAAALAESVERGVHLESDYFYRWIRSGFIPPHLPASHSQNTVVMDVVTDTAAGYAEAGYPVFWDGIVGPWFLDRVARRLTARGVGLRYLVVRAGREVSLARMLDRDGTPETTVAEVMWDQFADLGELESHVVQADGPVGEVVQRCRAVLASDGVRVVADAWMDDRWPVSVKGVIGWDDRVVVLRNRRGEWELPGGRLDATDPTPESALRREMREELGLDVEVGPLLDSWIYDVEGMRVLILTFACAAQRPSRLVHSDEHVEVGEFDPTSLRGKPIPEGYLHSISQVSLRR